MGASPLDPQSLRWLGAPPPDFRFWYVYVTLAFSTRFQSWILVLLKVLSLCQIRIKCRQATISNPPSYDIFVPQNLALLKIFDDIIACDLWFRPPSIKNLGYVYALENAWKKFLKTCFLENTSSCVLCPWPWPRSFLSLASRGPVLGKAVLGLDLGFFCVLGLGLEPCVLDSTSAHCHSWS